MSAREASPSEPRADGNPPDSYLTLGRPGTAEVKIQRSRFIAVASPAVDPETARSVIKEQARRFHDCRHVCHAWLLGTPPAVTEYRNDDGEPGGTAGEPILVEIRKLKLTQVVVVVVRYFGGVKLGTGGLARAYGQTAALALANAEVQVVKLGRTFMLHFPYALQKTIQHLLSSHTGKVQQENYQADVSWLIWLPHSQWQAFAAALRETTAGSVHLQEPDS